MYSIHLALTMYINSSFLQTYFSESITGLLFSASALITIAGLVIVPQMLKKFGEKRVLTVGMFINMLCLTGLALSNITPLIAILFMSYFSLNSLLLFSIDVAIKNVSTQANIGTMRGIFLSMKHLALMGAPLLAGALISNYGFHSVYGLAAVMLVIVILNFMRIQKVSNVVYEDQPILRTIKILRGSKNMLKIFSANFLLQFFYAWMIIYIPIHLVNTIGMSWDKIGGLISIMLAAFVVCSYPLGNIADKKGVPKPILVLGFLIMATSVFAIPFVTTSNFSTWAIILFSTRVGAAAVEVMTEAYFFKHTSPRDISTMSLFRNTHPLAYVLGPLVATIIISFTSHSFIFFILSFLLVIGALIVSTLPHCHKITCYHAN